jgi:hypothetical protein
MDKFYIAVKTLKSDVNFSYAGLPIETEEQFNNVQWITNGNSEAEAIVGDRPTEITWTKVKTEMDKL